MNNCFLLEDDSRLPELRQDLKRQFEKKEIYDDDADSIVLGGGMKKHNPSPLNGGNGSHLK